MKNGAKVLIKHKKSNKYLLQLRDNKPDIPNPNVWGSLGGGIEEGEEPLEALKRELKEESNIEIYNIRLLGAIKDELVVGNKTYPVTGHFFLAYTDYDLDKIEIYEGRKVDYFSLEEIEDMDNLASTTAKVINLYKDILK